MHAHSLQSVQFPMGNWGYGGFRKKLSWGSPSSTPTFTFWSWFAKLLNSYKNQLILIKALVFEQFTIEFVFSTIASMDKLSFISFISSISFRCIFIPCFYQLWRIKVSYITNWRIHSYKASSPYRNAYSEVTHFGKIIKFHNTKFFFTFHRAKFQPHTHLSQIFWSLTNKRNSLDFHKIRTIDANFFRRLSIH